MNKEDLITGKLYEAKGYPKHYYIFLKTTREGIRAHYFANNRLQGKDYPITNYHFWENGRETEFSEVESWIPKEFLPEKEINYQIF